MNLLDLPGPTFLLVYGIGFLFALWATHVVRIWARGPRTQPAEETLSSLSPHQIAMLRGGDEGAIACTIVTLVHRGRLVLEGAGLRVASKPTEAQLSGGAYREVEGLAPETPLERAVVAAIEKGAAKVSTITMLSSRALREIRASLVALSLFTSPDRRARREMLIRVPALLLIGLGLLKLVTGIARDRPVGVLLLFLLVSVLLLLVGNRDHRSGLGDEALALLSERHAALAPTARRAPQQLETHEVAMAASIFGAGAVAGPLAAWIDPPAAGDGGGASCGGSCGGGCGGGCGGCGG